MPNPRSGEARQDFIDRCMGSAEANADFPNADQRHAFCSNRFSEARNDVKQYIVTHQVGSARARTETFLGRTFRVVPAVLVRSQVLRNNLGSTLLPAEEITPEWAALWNSIPVLVGEHPSMRGQSISGRQPALLNERGVGWIFNARVEQEGDDARRLVAEVWLDADRAAAVEGFQAVLDAIGAGRPVELSTGFSVSVDQSHGVFNGRQYEAILHPGGADHLIISTEMTGACSVSDGCGLNVNEARLMSTQERSEDKGLYGKLREHVAALLDRKPARMLAAWRDNIAHRAQREIEIMNQVPPSDQERSNAIRDALQSKFGGQDKTVVVSDVYSAEGQVVFYFMTPFGPDPAGAEYFRSKYAEGEGGAYDFGDPERVRRMTVYEPVVQNGAPVAANSAAHTKPCGCHSEGTNMDATERKGLVDELTAAFSAALKPIAEQVSKVGEQATAAANAAVAPIKDGLEKALAKIEGQVAALSTSINAERDKERQALVTALSANAKTKDVYTAADLEAMNLEQLRKVAQIAAIEVTSFAGRGGPQVAANEAGEDEAFLPPRPYFAKDGGSTPTGARDGAEGK